MRRVLRAAKTREAPLAGGGLDDALRYSDGPREAAREFEAAVGGVRLLEWELGVGTHARHPPRDAYDEWLAPSMQRRMVQIAFGGHWRATYWLDARGWVHEIGPLDRLRPCAPSLDAFLDGLLRQSLPVHHGCIALAPLDAGDADALFETSQGCPLGDHIVRWPDDAMDALEALDWIERWAIGPYAVLSAPSLARLAEPLAGVLQLAPEVRVAILDGGPARRWELTLSEVVARTTAETPWTRASCDLELGRDGDGAWAIVEAQR